ncbi:hypothetical protein MMC24_000583 [Lignoscripta atroalba]|nr:hypothetical protein [Lignoscripta atroalba]
MATSHSMIQALQMAAISTAAVITGASAALSFVVIPIELLAPPKIFTTQFSATIQKGKELLQTSSRATALTFVVLAWSCSQHSDVALASKWRYYATSAALMVAIAPYEILYVFPVNDRIGELGERLQGESLEEKEEKELRALMLSWRRRNLGRVTLVFAAAAVGLWSVVGG